MDREIKFNAWIPKLKLMLPGVAVYASGLIGIDENDLRNLIKGKFILDTDSEEILPLDYFDNDDSEKVMSVLVGDEWIWFEEGEYELLQYSGVDTRADDVELFEGDTVEFSVFDYNDTDTQYKGVIVYCGSRFMIWKSVDDEFYGNDGGFDLDWAVMQDDEFKKTGNIFENKND